jgi:hypothetical protein
MKMKYFLAALLLVPSLAAPAMVQVRMRSSGPSRVTPYKNAV